MRATLNHFIFGSVVVIIVAIVIVAIVIIIVVIICKEGCAQVLQFVVFTALSKYATRINKQEMV